MNEIVQSFIKIASGLKTKAFLRTYKVYKMKKKLGETTVTDALNMYPEEVSLAKKKSDRKTPIALPRI